MAQIERSGPRFREDGAVEVPAFVLPISGLVSAEAAAAQRLRSIMPTFDAAGVEPEIAVRRQQINDYAVGAIARLGQQFPATITPTSIGGIDVLDVRPAGVACDPDRVLINLHGGGFAVGWDGIAQLESIPIAAMAGVRVVSVDYRMAPEHRHPAGVEDVATVFAALLSSYSPGRIGIYGGSAGGALTAQAAAWLPDHGLPQAGAVGIFGAGGVPFDIGESAYVAGYIDGSFPPPPADGTRGPDITRGYFSGCAPREASAWPGYHLDVLAKFPPALIITGTRAMDLSPAIFTHAQLLKAGVDSTLLVGESMGHCYHYQHNLPEGRDACEIIVRFFRKNLG